MKRKYINWSNKNIFIYYIHTHTRRLQRRAKESASVLLLLLAAATATANREIARKLIFKLKSMLEMNVMKNETKESWGRERKKTHCCMWNSMQLAKRISNCTQRMHTESLCEFLRSHRHIDLIMMIVMKCKIWWKLINLAIYRRNHLCATLMELHVLTRRRIDGSNDEWRSNEFIGLGAQCRCNDMITSRILKHMASLGSKSTDRAAEVTDH